jgi:transposase InsO family protein
MIGISSSRYYDWHNRFGIPNQHNGKFVRDHWILPDERQAILDYCCTRLEEGYRRLTYMMLDADVVAVSPATTYRVLRHAGLLKRWNLKVKTNSTGFKQPGRVHDHWHVDISYVNILGTIYFLISVLDGASRYVLSHDLRTNMTEHDIEITIEGAKERFPEAKPRIISDNGPQFISKDFKEFIRLSGFTHVRTSRNYPQSNGKLERFFGTIKREQIRKNSYLSIQDAKARIAQYIEYYNTNRLHSAIYYLTPEDVIKERVDEKLQIRQNKLDQARNKRKLIRKVNKELIKT